jgi:hypothetical protein
MIRRGERMKTKIAGLVAVLLLIGVNGLTADGDLIVNGKIGIGTISPVAKLHVYGGGSGTQAIGLGQNEQIRWRTADGSAWRAGIYGETANSGDLTFVSTQGRGIRFMVDSDSDLLGANEIMRVSNGNVGIGNSNPAYLLTMEPSGGGFYDQSTHNWVSVSSGRWKSNIKPMTKALETVLKLNAVSFKWKKRTDLFETSIVGEKKYISSSWDDDPNGRDDIGLIGEEVRKVLPEVVAVDQKDSHYVAGVAYSKMVPLLIEAIKDQQKQIEALKSEVADLKAKQ